MRERVDFYGDVYNLIFYIIDTYIVGMAYSLLNLNSEYL